MTKVRTLFNKIHNKFLDLITPLQVWFIVHFNKNSWASTRADQIIRKSESRTLRNLIARIQNRWQVWMNPENGGTSLIIALAFVFLPQFILAFCFYSFFRPVFTFWKDTEALQSTLVLFWQVLASIIGITFVIIVFLTQYVVDRKFERRALPLFATRTWMVFTVMMGMLTLFSMGGNILLFDMIAEPVNHRGYIIPEFLTSIALYNLSLFFVNIILSIRLYIITYKLLSPSYFKEEFRKYLQKIVKNGVHTELRNRLAQSLVIEQCNKEGPQFSIFDNDNYLNKAQVSLPKLSKTISVIEDVNLELLQIVATRAKRILGGQDAKAITFLGKLGRRMSTERPQIAFIPHGCEQKQIIHPIQKSVRVKPLADRRGQSALDDDLVLIQDLIASAIKNGYSDEVENLITIYWDTLQFFLETFEVFGVQYSLEMVYSELGIFSDWPFVSSIQKQYSHLLEFALESDDSQIVHHFTDFPFRVMALAFHQKDHLLFHRFSDLYTTIYVQANRFLKNQELKKTLKDRTWRLLVDFDNKWIAKAVEKQMASIQDLENVTNYSIQILFVLNRLLKASIDQKDWEQYRNCIDAMRQIYKQVNGRINRNQLNILKMKMEEYPEQQAPESLQQDYRRVEEIVKQKQRIENTRRVLMMGIGAYFTHLFEAGQITPTDLSNHLSAIADDFLSAEEMYEVYCAHISNKDNLRDMYTSRLLQEINKMFGEPTIVPKAFSWLARYYVIRMLELMPTNENMAQPELKPFANSKSTLDTVKNQLDYLEKTPAWQDYLQINEPTYRYRVNVLIQSHQKAADEQEILEEMDIVNLPLDSDKIDDFSRNVQMNWLKSAILRSLFVFHNKYEERPDAVPPDGLLAPDIKQLDKKGVFVNQDRFQYLNWGNEYGRKLGTIEDRFLVKEMLNLEITTVPEPDLDAAIQQTLKAMKSSGYSPMIFCLSENLFSTLYRSPHFKPKWRAQNILVEQLGARGLFEDSLTFALENLKENKILFIDFKAYATLVQYRPTEKKDFPLYISIEEISTEKAKEILSKNPEWEIHPKTQKKLSEEEALRRIQQYVIIQIWERFRLENVNPMAGKVLQVIDAKNSHSSQTGE